MIQLKRAYEEASPGDGPRILVERLWPRGVKKTDAAIDFWIKEVAPSAELRKWFAHDPKKWGQFECTGALTRREDLEKHIRAGAQFVLLSAPSKSEEVGTVVHGVNVPGRAPAIVSCASCTTNCITPIVEVIGRRIGILKAVMTSVHAYTASQAIVDGPNKHLRSGRAAAANLIPASTGAAHATTKALPAYQGLFDGIAIRVPVPVGSLADITFITKRKTSVAEVNEILTEEAGTQRYAGVLGVSHDPLVSSEIVGDPRASIVDLELTKVIDGDLVKVLSWYDNEWGYANQMVREAISVAQRR
jgi:glyceraldehyde 3-phosphate dehydrogenase